MNHHTRIDASASIQPASERHESVLRRHAIRLATFLAASIMTLGALPALVWHGIIFHPVR